MTDTEPVAETTDSSLDTLDVCQPFRFDFDQLVSQIDTAQVDRAITHKVRDLVDHLGRHLAEENPELTERQIGRVLVSASAVIAVLALRSRTWTATGVLNLVSSTGAHLWHQHDPAPEPTARIVSAYWALWTKDGRIRAVEEFEDERTEAQVREALAIDGEHSRQLEPISRERAIELRQLVEKNPEEA